MTLTEIEKVLSGVIHPEYDKSVIELGLVQNLDFVPDSSTIKFRLVFHRADPLSGTLKDACTQALNKAFPGVGVSIVELIDSSKATANKRIGKGHSPLGENGSEDTKQLSEVKKVIAIASGKGGVGKSTVAVNLAVTLAKLGFKTGLLDADIYGPSVPKMTATEGAVPEMVTEHSPNNPEVGADLIVPVEKYGVKWMSIGYFAQPGQALIWRGPMATGALRQLAYDVKWGALDYLLIDLPPGTGDIHISMIQEIKLAGAIIVTTPQAIALADVEKGINMFRNKEVNTPIIGIVENMSWFTPAELPDNKYYIFGREGGRLMAEKYGVPLLAQIPIVQSVMEGGETGRPEALSNGPVSDAFVALAQKISI